MPKELKNQIKEVSMTLDDFEEGTTSFEEKVDKVLGKEPDVREKDVRLSEKGIVELVEEKCLSCGSDNIVKNGTNPKSLERGLRIEVERYVCNDCENDFTAPVEGYLKKTNITETKR